MANRIEDAKRKANPRYDAMREIQGIRHTIYRDAQRDGIGAAVYTEQQHAAIIKLDHAVDYLRKTQR